MVVNAQSEMVEERDGEPVIFSFIQNYISVFFFLYTHFRHSISSSLLQKKKSTYLYYIMFSKQQIPSANYLWVCSPSLGTCCIF